MKIKTTKVGVCRLPSRIQVLQKYQGLAVCFITILAQKILHEVSRRAIRNSTFQCFRQCLDCVENKVLLSVQKLFSVYDTRIQ